MGGRHKACPYTKMMPLDRAMIDLIRDGIFLKKIEKNREIGSRTET